MFNMNFSLTHKNNISNGCNIFMSYCIIAKGKINNTSLGVYEMVLYFSNWIINTPAYKRH